MLAVLLAYPIGLWPMQLLGGGTVFFHRLCGSLKKTTPVVWYGDLRSNLTKWHSGQHWCHLQHLQGSHPNTLSLPSSIRNALVYSLPQLWPFHCYDDVGHYMHVPSATYLFRAMDGDRLIVSMSTCHH